MSRWLVILLPDMVSLFARAGVGRGRHYNTASDLQQWHDKTQATLELMCLRRGLSVQPLLGFRSLPTITRVWGWGNFYGQHNTLHYLLASCALSAL